MLGVDLDGFMWARRRALPFVASLKGILAVSREELVSSDFRGNPHSAIVDAPFTKVVDGDAVKVLAWYDNEWGFSCRVIDLIHRMADRGL